MLYRQSARCGPERLEIYILGLHGRQLTSLLIYSTVGGPKALSLTSVHFLSIIHHPKSWETFLRGRKSQATSISTLFLSNFKTTFLEAHTPTHTHPTMLLLVIRILKDKRFLPRFVLFVQYSNYINIIGENT